MLRCFLSMLGMMCLSIQAHGASDLAERLALTSQVWGYLKYHHTGTCQTNWDQVLIEALNAIDPEDDQARFNDTISNLIMAAGPNQPAQTALPAAGELQAIGADLSWMSDPELSQGNRDRLAEIVNQFRPNPSCHVGLSVTQEPLFDQDNQYHAQSNTDRSLRLLSIARFWNIINYFFPYKHLIDADWSAVQVEMMDRMLAVETETAYHLLMREFSAQIDDTHAHIYSVLFEQTLGFLYTPFRMDLVEGKTVVTRILPGSPLRLGDEILSLNGQSVAQRRAELAPLIAASNPVTAASISHRYLERGVSPSVRVEYRRDDAIDTVTLRRANEYRQFIVDPVGPRWQRFEYPECDLGYINMGLLQEQDIDTVLAEFADTDGIVFDLRNYPNGTIWSLMSRLFANPIDVALFHKPRVDFPGNTERLLGRIGTRSTGAYDGRLKILFNEQTVSQAEYSVMALENHPGAVKIGSQTQGADGDITRIDLPGQLSLWMTGIGVYYPDGRDTQRIGIVPDVRITPTIAGIRAGTDEVLQAALDCGHVLDSNWPQPTPAASALYFDPSHAGHGFDVTDAGVSQILVNYTYRADGSPVWYLATGAPRDARFELNPDEYAEYRYQFDQRSTSAIPVEQARFDLDFRRGPQSIACAVESNELRVSPARLDWHQTDQAVQWCPEVFVFDRGQTPDGNIDGLWYAGESDAGWGLTIRRQGQTLFVVLYYYNQEGEARWATASGRVSSDEPTAMPLIETRGYCFSCDKTAIEATEIGSVSLFINRPSQQLDAGNWVSIQATSLGDDQAWVREQTPIRLLSEVID